MGVSPQSVTGRRSVLIVLKESEAKSKGPQQQQQQQQQQTVVIGGDTRSSAKQLGTVNVTANVEGADVIVDGMFVGNAPATLKLTEGVHVLEVKKDGSGTYRREIRVMGDAETTLRATLQ